MRKLVPAAALFALLIGCAVDSGSGTPPKQVIAEDAADPSPETYALGSMVTADGAVPKDAAAEAFQRGREVFLSIDVSGASTDSTIEVKWTDAAGHLIRQQTRSVPLGAHYAAFASGHDVTATSGEHRALVVINGRRVSEKAFRVL